MGEIISVNRRTYPTQGPGDSWSETPPTVVTVLVGGSIGDYAAYTGIGDPQWVARNGDKIRYEEACCHFPIGLEREKYRD